MASRRCRSVIELWWPADGSGLILHQVAELGRPRLCADGKELELSIDFRNGRRCSSGGAINRTYVSLLLCWLSFFIAKSPLPNIPTGFLTRASRGVGYDHPLFESFDNGAESGLAA